MTVRRLTTVVFILLSIALLGVLSARSSGQSAPKSPDGPAKITPAPETGDTFTIDPTHSMALFRIQHFGAGAFWGRFNRVTGTIVHDDDNDPPLRLDVTMDINSIDVGNDQLDEPWLDEAMAQYATWVYWRETQGEGGDEGFRAHLDSRWARVEHADIPIGLPAEAYESTEYGAIVYGRGPLFVDVLAMIVGQETFEEFLAEYATKFKYGIASTQDYQALVERHCGCDLSQEFEAVVYPR